MEGRSPVDVLVQFSNFMLNTGPFLHTVISTITPWALLITAITEHKWVCEAFGAITGTINSFFLSQVVIDSNAPLHRLLLRFLASETLTERVRTLRLDGLAWEEWDPEEHYDPKSKGKMAFAPDAGSYSFYFEGHRLNFERRITQVDTFKGAIQDHILISCMNPFAGPSVIKRFLDHVLEKSATERRSKTTMWRPERTGWKWYGEGVSRHARDLTAVELEQGTKESLVKDVEAYLHARTRNYYINRGIPWRPPGTGKTSFTTALAGHFELDIYLIGLSSSTLDDQRLESLFAALPGRCIVLFEDIDSAGIRRGDMCSVKRAMAKGENGSDMRTDEEGNPLEIDPVGVTLAGLLNVLDGVDSVEGRIVIMTSNNPNSLDEALVRRGRIDRKIEFRFASRSVSAALFKRVYCKSQEELLPGEAPLDEAEMHPLANEFASSLPENALTPAEVLGFLLDNRTDPKAAVAGMPAHAREVVKRRAQGLNVARQEEEEQQEEPQDEPPTFLMKAALAQWTLWSTWKSQSRRQQAVRDIFLFP
ncbi:hypothetical protein KC360_g2428 [Hortaea werneckii]|nr:hypothetical protein KC361_g1692 [Hortaea werneckii]KAI6886520.1 hypothetical protein KC325_g2784 [Hortaea werneckii]KAI6996575.1 hypothetical protein KC359_g3436 [Hortaea werneckii]KAI7149555.1 hypothetical protein KC344_g910 [Hortaea werneckii]KAI7177271.1 hypothetical protein KC360_g2428 [Hortaea werneckii]